MKPLVTLLMVLFVQTALLAQQETFDIVTYSPPSGWKKATTDYVVSYSIVDNSTGSWCQLAIYKSVQSNGIPTADFSSEWKALVKPETYAGAVEPQPTALQGAAGWTHNIGESNFQWQGKAARISLLNLSGYGLMVSILISTNSGSYDNDIIKFISSLQLQTPTPKTTEPVANQTAQQSAQATTQLTTTNTTPIKITSAQGISGIVLSTTNFDDGWVAKPFADYVLVAKQPVNVLLHYAIEIDDQMRQVGNMAVALWDRMITSRYKVSNVKVFQNPPYTYNGVWFVEADAMDLSTNKPCYVALRVLIANGIATPIEIVAPSMEVLQKEFPDQEKIERMLNYNKFAVSPKDLVGTWEESSSTGVNMYNTTTGAYAGMNATAMANTFEFRGDGSYHSNHKGASGMVGSMSFYDQKYDGKYTLTSWDVTMTNRFKGKTDVYWCQYEAVRGGRVLRLVQKDAVGMNYRLVKTK